MNSLESTKSRKTEKNTLGSRSRFKVYRRTSISY